MQSLREKKKQATLTIRWLEENYCQCEGVCLPRNVLYTHYLDFCGKQRVQPACAATFGKTIRQKFPHLTTRRLGTRGHSKYHYYGIGIKESSEYYTTVYATKGITRFSDCKLQHEGGFTRQYSLSCKLGTLLPEFPSSAHLSLPQGVAADRVETLLMMYRTHCQCLLDTTITANFMQLETYVSHFWQGLPGHIHSLLGIEAVQELICVCDLILYKTMAEVLIPSSMQEMPNTLLCDVRNLGDYWLSWMTSSLQGLPHSLCVKKCHVARQFSLSLKRQVSFIHLAQTSRPVLYNAGLVNQMMADMDGIDPAHMGAQCMGIELLQAGGGKAADHSAFTVGCEILKEFKEILRRQATVEGFIEWIDSLVEKYILLPSECGENALQKLCQDFMLRWSFFGSRISHCLTLNNAKSFGSLHLLRLLLDEYLLLATEAQLNSHTDTQLTDRLHRHYVNTDACSRASPTPPSAVLSTPFTAATPVKAPPQYSDKTLQQTVCTSKQYNVHSVAAGNDRDMAGCRESYKYRRGYGDEFTIRPQAHRGANNIPDATWNHIHQNTSNLSGPRAVSLPTPPVSPVPAAARLDSLPGHNIHNNPVTPWNMPRKKEYHPQPSQYSTRANPHPYPQEKRRCHHHDHHDNVYNIYTVYGNYISTDPACNSTMNRTPSHSNTYHQAEQQYDFSRMGEAADNGIWGYNHPADFAVQPYNMNGLHCHSAYENQTAWAHTEPHGSGAGVQEKLYGNHHAGITHSFM